MSISPIRKPLPGERVVTLSLASADEAQTTWLRRPNLFTGRALTQQTLEAQQQWLAGRLALRGQAVSAGVVQGLEVAIESIPPAEEETWPRQVLHIAPGLGLSASGEDVVVARHAALALYDLPVYASAALLDTIEGRGAGGTGEATGARDAKRVGRTLGEYIRLNPGALPRAGVLVLQPVIADQLGEFDPTDPCELDPENFAFEDWRLGDGARVLFYAWPGEWRAPPGRDAQWRNRIAYTIFDAERALREGELLPWEEIGVPISAIGFDDNWQTLFTDRGAVVRTGGRPRQRGLSVVAAPAGGSAPGLARTAQAGARHVFLWQAQLEQLSEQIAEASGPPPADELAQQFRLLPPAGLLPKDAFDVTTRLNRFFPASYTVDAVPVPLEQLDAALEASASLAPFDTGHPDRVRLLVPVPQPMYEPRLLLTETVDEEFDRTLTDFLGARATWLGARQSVRAKAAALQRAITGRDPAFPPFDKDPDALEPESLVAPGELMPGTGGHRSAARAGLHQHFFERATGTLGVAAGNKLFAWVQLDPDNPPRTLMLQWNTGNWEHRAYWGENLINWGADGTPSRLRLGDLPEKGKWVRLEIPAEVVGVAGATLNGMAFTLFDGRVAFGPSGKLAGTTETTWFANLLPSGARVGTGAPVNLPWEFLAAEELAAPFEDDFDTRIGHEPVVPSNGGHLSPARAGQHQHFFDGATATLNVVAGDKLFAWVQLDPANPPRTLMLQWRVGTSWEHRAYWGENLINWGTDGTPSRLRLGELPETGGWVRLEVPAEAVGVAGATLNGMAFTLFDGRVAFGASGRLAGTTENAWFSNTLPGGATARGDEGSWEFLTAERLAAPFVKDFRADQTVRAADALDALRDDPALTSLSLRERARLETLGVEGFINFLKARVDQADDFVDYGFTKIQTDIYRVRQLMLGTTAATRLAVSPTLASIAKAETATASQQQIESFFGKLHDTTAKTTPPAGTGSTSSAPSLPPPTPVSRSSISTGIGTVSIGVRDTTALLFGRSVSGVESGTSLATIVKRAADAGTFVQLSKTPSPVDIRGEVPLVGKAEIRTTTVAQRLEAPKAEEAKDYTTATRHETVSRLVQFANTLIAEDQGVIPGLFHGVDVFGLEKDPFLPTTPTGQPAIIKRPFLDFLRDNTLVAKLASMPVRTQPDEAKHFSDSVDLSDRTVAVMRQLEGRIRFYRNAIAACERALAALRELSAAAQRRLAAVGEKLAEARHDVSVARALLAEEQQRVATINERRARILNDEVRFLAYHRPRALDNLTPVPLRNIDPGLIEAPVPACLRQQLDIPDELRDMLNVVREAPARWFTHVPQLLASLDRMDMLLKVVQSAQIRTQVQQLKPVLALATGATAVQRSIASVFNAQRESVLSQRVVATRLDLTQLATLTWQGARDRAAEVVSLGDLIDGEHGKGEVARRAATEFDQIGRIAGCLHAELAAVLPAIRLDWAERLSQYDASVPLRNLANLPRWGEIGYVDRKQMQTYVDWLFQRIDPREPKAEALMNDVVRMCLLLASHAPVNRIIAGRLARPTPVVPGGRIPLLAVDPARVRIGMHALVYRGQQIVARAVVDDLGAGEVSARVVHSTVDRLDDTDGARVQFTDLAAPIETAVRAAARPLKLW